MVEGGSAVGATASERVAEGVAEGAGGSEDLGKGEAGADEREGGRVATAGCGEDWGAREAAADEEGAAAAGSS